MIEINRETGAVTWGDYALNRELTPDAFMQRYPRLTPMRDIQTLEGQRELIYRLPSMNLGNYWAILELSCYNDKLSLMVIKRPFPGDAPEDIERWRRGLPGWVATAQEWLVSQLGQAPETKPGFLMDEEQWLTADEIKLLQNWTYDFEWGQAGFHYDGLEEPGEVYVHYSSHKPIRNWDELIAECDGLIRSEQEQNGEYITSLLALRLLIGTIRPHYDFQSIRPRLFPSGINFSLPQGKSKVTVEVRPSNHALERYMIWRWDTGEKSFVAEGNDKQLVDKLRQFLDAEKP